MTFEIVKTNAFHFEPVQSQDGSDFFTQKLTIDVQAVINPSATSYSAGPSATAGVAAATTVASIRHALSEPRRQLLVTDRPGGNVLMSSPPGGNTRDVMGGPFPEPAEVHLMGATKSMLLRWRCTTYLTECPGEGSSPPPLVSNRWSNVHSIDANQLPTITWSGVAQFRMDALEDTNSIVDNFRARCIPPKPAGFTRISLTISPSVRGDSISYQAVDAWEYVKLGDANTTQLPDMLRFEADYTQSSTKTDKGMPGGFVMERFQGRAFGRPTAARSNLLVGLVKLAFSRISLPVGANRGNTDAVLTSVSAHESLNSPVASFSLEVTRPAAQQAAQMGGLRNELLTIGSEAFQFANPLFDSAGLTPSLIDNETRSPVYFGYAIAAALQDACSAPTPIKDPGGSVGSGTYYNATPSYSNALNVVVGVAEGALQQSPTSISSANGQGQYTEYRIDNLLVRSSGKVQVRVASPADGSSPTSGGGNPGSLNPGDGGATQGCEVFSLGSPMTSLVSEWSAERMSTPPTPPSTDLKDANFVLLDDETSYPSVVYMNDQVTPVFRVEGRYTYACLSPIGAGSTIPFPVTPNYTTNYGDYAINPPDWTTGLIDEGSGDAPPGGVIGGIPGGNG